MERRDPSTDRLWLVFALTSLAMLVVLAVSPVKDFFREYRRYQKDYRALVLRKAGSLKEVRSAQALQVGIRQSAANVSFETVRHRVGL